MMRFFPKAKRWSEGRDSIPREHGCSDPSSSGIAFFANYSSPELGLSRPLNIHAGELIALEGYDLSSKHVLCDWLLGVGESAHYPLNVSLGEKEIVSPRERAQLGAVFGRSPVSCGNTLQEKLLYRTHDIRKQELYFAIEKLMGDSLRARCHPLNPLLDRSGQPLIATGFSAREQIEISQINLVLQRLPFLVVDFAAPLLRRAINAGFKLSPELSHSGKTIVLILGEEGSEKEKAEHWLELGFSQTITMPLPLLGGNRSLRQ